MESCIMMVIHSVIIGFVLFIIMFFVLCQKQIVAETRSVLLASLILAYMLLFGHGLPTSLNKNLF